MRASTCTIFMLLAIGAPVRAADQPVARNPDVPGTQAAPVSSQHHRPVRKTPRAGRTAPGGEQPSKAAGNGILAPLDPAKAGVPKAGVAAGGWSIAPEWKAANGGSSAAYGTRALINEMQLNPAETTGYGAGAKLDFHF